MNPSELYYRLVVVQQPLRARVCGFSDKDKRQITSPPIVKLLIHAANPALLANVDTSNLVITVELWSADGTTNMHIVNLASPHPKQGLIFNLIGSLTSPAYALRDLNDEMGIFFVFRQLSIRTEGEYRLKFSLVDLSIQTMDGASPVLTSIFSDPFRSYSASTFPGVIGTTALSKKFAEQGIKLSNRRKNTTSEEI